jgi:serine phosphatase RsbU (regulator of sigma subunit)
MRLTERRLAMLGGIAQQIAAAVDNARLAAAREEEAWNSTLLLQVSEIVRRVQPLELALDQVARLVPALTGVDRCTILLRDGQGVYRARAVAASDEAFAVALTEMALAPGDLALLDDALRSGQPVVVDDMRGNPRAPEDWEQRFGSRTLLVMPLLVGDEPIGALLADDVETTHLFSPRRVRILNGIANQAAIAIENYRLQAQEAERARINRELELAHDIQRSLLPQGVPYVAGYQIAYRWQAAREVGGDFFDFMPLPGGGLALVVADVSDKGIPAALYMMFARTLLRAAVSSGRTPAAALERSNELMLADSVSDMFVTAYCGALDPRAHSLTVASAGHNLAIYAPRGAAPIPLTTEGIPLGIAAPAGVGERRLALASGDVVIFYTDGVTDALAPNGAEFGDERLLEVVAAQRGGTAEEIAAAIEAAVQDFAGEAAQADDLTLIVLKREESETVSTDAD